MTDKHCLITGVGPGTGAELARRFARDGYAVSMIARNAERLKALENELERATGYICDVSDADQLHNTL
ncbi:MAG: SDR family NAD(P)-dependent oxidoreductase, partial [Pseudomonadota bacterium]